MLLAASDEGATKTAIVYKVGFNFGRVEKYIELMLSTNLLEQLSSEPYCVYKTTRRGLHAIKMLEDADEFIFGTQPDERNMEKVFALASKSE